MDGGSGLNLLYAETLDAMGIDHSRLRPSKAPFHGVVPGKQAMPLGQIDLPVTFGTPSNYRKEVLTFEVVGFRGTYHAILGRPCYAKFMAIPNYTYLKLKLPRPNGVITVGTTFQKAYECDVECCEYAAAVTLSSDVAVQLAEAIEDQPNTKQSGTSFKPTEGIKEVPLDPGSSSGGVVRISTALSPK
ncbi:uncharacterized protein [Setaria viridis]|uniref:uncharacterized protein n=1 Tax=Setaria viridis TaxID=4556 RepID=UPI0014933E31|nr:uncharacterized protein LOC117862060 [Setaria viridis]